MNASFFILTAAILTFATGFFVASIIWSIKWFLSASEERKTRFQFHHFIHLLNRLNAEEKQIMTSAGNFTVSAFEESENNDELYQYHHGEN